MERKIDLVDYLKGYSIFTIILFHLIQLFNFYNWPNIIRLASNLGGAGVHVFFVCSGFGLYLSYMKKPITYKKFIKKRFLKIYTPYIIVVLLSSCLPIMYSGSDRMIATLSHVFLFKMFVPMYEESFGTHLWFISTIIQFYLIFYVLIWIKNRLGNKKYMVLAIFISLAYGLIVSLLKNSDVRTWNSFFIQYLWEFALGMIFADYYYKKPSVFKKPNLVWLFILSTMGLVITGITGYLGGVYKIFNDYTSLLGYGGLSVFIYFLNIKVINKFFIWINKFSYEWYLVHILIFTCMAFLLQNFTPSIIVFIMVFITSMYSAFLYNVIIQKVMKRTNKFKY